MVAGGTTDVTDIIAHFAGHLRLLDDAARPRDTYQDPAHPLRPQPWLPKPLVADDPDRPLDELPSRPFRAGLSPDDDAFPRLGRLPGHDVPAPALGEPDAGWLLPAARLRPAGGGGGGGGGGGHRERPDEPSPDQELVQVVQANRLKDDDLVLTKRDVDLSGLHDIDIDATIAALSLIAASQRPDDLVLGSPSTEAAIVTVLRHEAILARDGEHPQAGTGGATDGSTEGAPEDAPMGTYLDGVLQPPGTALTFTVPKAPLVAPESRDGLVETGTEAWAGGNLSVNAASILDDHGHGTSLVVRGDSYTTDAIVQVNVLASRAVVEAAGEALVRSIVTDGNEAHNTARIADHDTAGLFQRQSFGGGVTVDRIEGDFYGVNVLRQVNLLSDNDVIVQGHFGAYYAVRTGENAQTNAMALTEIGARYDLIVVEGDYHSANVIQQTNILFNDDVVYAYTARHDGASQTISTGGNILENKAAIDRYGSDDFKPLSATLGDSLDRLQDGGLPPELAATFPANGGTLRVLYVTGDFYDINVIQQTNVVSDVDGIVQHAPAGRETSPEGTPTTSVQHAESGGNHLANLAGIAQVGTGSDHQYVGGTHYDSAILIQANFVTESSQITLGDTSRLVPEIVAFTGIADTAPAEPSGPVAVTADSHMQQDLFHGMLS